MKKRFLIISIVLVAIFLFFSGSIVNGQRVISTPIVEWVSHTEYWTSSGVGAGEQASTIVRLTNYRGDPFQVNSCLVSIYYPNKTPYIVNASMAPSSVPGNWYHNVSIPSVTGTYEQNVVCSYPGGSTTTSQSFHVNPALEFIKQVDADVIAADTKLTNVNANLTALVQNSTSQLTVRINLAESNLDSLVNAVNNSVSSQLANVHGNLNTKMENINVSIQATVANTGQTIITQVRSTETNLTNLLNSVNSQLQSQLGVINISTDTKLTNVQVTLSGQMDNVLSTILVQINTTETSLTNFLTRMNSSIASQLSSVNAGLDSTLISVNYSLSAQLGDTKTAIQNQLTNVNTDLTGLINTAKNGIMSYLQMYLPVINQTTTNIYNDTQWLITNAINYGSETNARFGNLDNNLSLIEDFCNNAQTTNSRLCQEVYGIRNNLTILRGESQAYFENLNRTTVNIFDKLTGDMTISLNDITSNLLFVKGQTTDINDTVQRIRQDQTGEVRAVILS